MRTKFKPYQKMSDSKTKSDEANRFEAYFKEAYLTYHSGLVRFAQSFIKIREDAENIVQDAFADIWETGGRAIQNRNHLLALLFTLIKNKSIDYLRHEIVVREAETIIQEEYRRDMQMKFDTLEAFDNDLLASGESVEDLLHKAIDALPEQCRKIFIMNKLEGKKQSDIATELKISINTVESQMSVAYRKLRKAMKNNILLLFLTSL